MLNRHIINIVKEVKPPNKNMAQYYLYEIEKALQILWSVHFPITDVVEVNASIENLMTFLLQNVHSAGLLPTVSERLRACWVPHATY